ncbi:hypothetical protein MNBD_ALPHA04-1613 [hydrothermal vent metagenome]|uniref:Flagella basal body P-ring formation protein FlgA SAF domain-containing protein n=1 Tax=hydrothermal vent metagenome TaxID=652676 RepID=A0A3B0RHD1_9ZZZZ
MKIKAFTIISTFLAMSICSPHSTAKEFQSLETLDLILQQALGRSIGEAGGPRTNVDRRLKLENCPETPRVDTRNISNVIIRCTALNWRISVPLVTATTASRRSFAAEQIIQRGQPVLLVVRQNGFVISRQMIADRKGRLGDVIPVRMTRRSSPILVEITGPGRVTIPRL